MIDERKTIAVCWWEAW